MTGVQWVRLDTAFPDNPKVLELVHAGHHRTVFVYVCGLAYSGAQGNEGWLPVSALVRIHGRKQDAARLVDSGLWEAHPGGWAIHDWLEYQPTNETIAIRTKRAQAAALVRWHGPNGQP